MMSCDVEHCGIEGGLPVAKSKESSVNMHSVLAKVQSATLVHQYQRPLSVARDGTNKKQILANIDGIFSSSGISALFCIVTSEVDRAKSSHYVLTLSGMFAKTSIISGKGWHKYEANNGVLKQ